MALVKDVSKDNDFSHFQFLPPGEGGGDTPLEVWNFLIKNPIHGTNFRSGRVWDGPKYHSYSGLSWRPVYLNRIEVLKRDQKIVHLGSGRKGSEGRQFDEA